MPALPQFPSSEKWPALREILTGLRGVVVAVSGGVDSLLLATLAHRTLPGRALMAHTTGPAVPAACTERVRQEAARQGWRLTMVATGELLDERYLANPFDRCYFCKTHLYARLASLAADIAGELGVLPVVVSGANADDLGEHRPGLVAASELAVRHPFVEAGVAKADIRAMARELGLSFADIPASPCLASRIYTGTRVTPEILGAISFAEEFLKERLHIDVVRCRVRETDMLLGMLVEAPEPARRLVTPAILAELGPPLCARFPSIQTVDLDPEPYRPGRAFRSDDSHGQSSRRK